MESQMQPCKIAAAAAMIVLLLLTNSGGRQGLPAVAGEEQCTAVRRSTTFKGDCISGPNGNEAACNDACRHEGDAKGYCFTDLDGQHACICASPCTIPPASMSATPGSLA